MNFIKIILLIVTFLLSLSCYKNRQKESSALTNNFKFKTFIEVSKKKGEFIIYKPCDGPTRKLKWNAKNELEIIEVVEDLKKKISYTEEFRDGFRIYYGNGDYYDFRIFDKEKRVYKVTCKRKDNFSNKNWGIPPFVVDLDNSKSFRLLKQPCLECYTEEQCIALGEMTNKKKSKAEKNYEKNTKVNYKIFELNIGKREINLEIPIPSGYDKLPKNIEAYKLNGDSGSFLFVIGERECDGCPFFVSTHNTEGELLSYSYQIKKSGERRIIASKGKNLIIFEKYGITDQEINIQMNNPKVTKYKIKN
ncbi:hypothetical protein V2590_13695 [Tenacibaculum maritimum]|uniref:hypothetical protein n=1 Tax=Tenacibaculum maritimum TaxID=107401 RepID=UPI0038764715